jgi:hypothetical protein
MGKTIYQLAAVLTIWAWCAGCSPAQWVAAGQVAGGAIDGAAVARADQIRASARLAEDAAREGDTIAAMRLLNDALATMAAEQFRDLQAARAQCSRSPVPVPTASASAAPLDSVTPPPTPAVP